MRSGGERARDNPYSKEIGELLSLMRTIEKWHFRIRWGGRWTTTRIAYTEEQIRREHPDAVKIDNTRVVVEEPETEEERAAVMRSTLTSSNQRTEYHPDGSIKKMWE